MNARKPSMPVAWAAVAMLSTLASGCLFEEQLVDRFTSALDASAADVLVLSVDDGDLEITGDPNATRVEVDVEIWSRFSDDRAMDHVDLSFFETAAGEIRLSVSIDEDASGGTYAHLWVRVPSRFVVDGLDRTGDVWIRGVAAVAMVDDSGDIEVRDVPGEVLIDDDSGDVELQDVGSVRIDDRSGDLNVRGVEGDVTIDDGSGDIDVESVGGDVSVNDGSGDIELRDIDGIVSIRDGDGDIRAGRVGELRVLSDRSGSVRRF